MEEKCCIEPDYKKECEQLRLSLKEALNKLEQYKKALLNVCLKI